MPRGQPLDRDLVRALRLLDAVDRPYAEVWRALRPVAADLARPCPSYGCVREFLIFERRRKLAREALMDAVVGELLSGRAPWSLMRSL